MVDAGLAPGSDAAGLVIVQRLHRMVRHGYRPWLGYPVAGGQDRTVHLHRRDGMAVLQADGSVAFTARDGRPDGVVAAADGAGFDARLPPDQPNRRNLVRRLYEIGFLAR